MAGLAFAVRALPEKLIRLNQSRASGERLDDTRRGT